MGKKKNAWHRLLELGSEYENGNIDVATYWLRQDKISWEAVRVSREWKDKKSKLLRKKCELCISTGPLVLAAPRSLTYNASCYVAKKYFVPEVLKKRPLDVSSIDIVPPVPREICPFCNSISVRFRKTTQDYACNYKKCKRSGFTKVQVIMYQRLSDEEQIRRAEEKWAFEIMEKSKRWQKRVAKEATLVSIRYILRALALREQDVCTLCKSCHFKAFYNCTAWGHPENWQMESLFSEVRAPYLSVNGFKLTNYGV